MPQASDSYADLTPHRVLDALDAVGPARRRPPAAAQFVREPRLPGDSGGRLRRWWPSSTGPGAGATRRSSRSTLRAASLPRPRCRWSRRCVLRPRARRAARLRRRAADAGRVGALSASRWRQRRCRARARTRGPDGAANGSAASSAACMRWARASRSRIGARSMPATFGHAPRAAGCSTATSCPTRSAPAWQRGVRRGARAPSTQAFDAADGRRARCGCTATAIPATCCGATRARTSSTSTTACNGPGGAGPVDAAVGRRGSRCAAQLAHAARRLRRVHAPSTRASWR